MLEDFLKLLCTKKVYGTIIIVFMMLIIYTTLNSFLNKIVIKGKNDLERKRKKTVITLFNNLLKYIIIIVMILVLLNLYGINTTSIIAGLGIVGVVIGFALQDALKDIISGITIIMDNYFVVGDYVDFNGFVGTIIEFGLKTTKIKKMTGEIYSISNRNIDKIINISQEKSNIYLTIPTAYEENYDKVEKIITDVLNEAKKKYKEVNEVEFLGIDNLAESSVNYLVRVKCERETQYNLRRAILRDIKIAYDKNKIKIPYNQLEVHNGTKL